MGRKQPNQSPPKNKKSRGVKKRKLSSPKRSKPRSKSSKQSHSKRSRKSPTKKRKKSHKGKPDTEQNEETKEAEEEQIDPYEQLKATSHTALIRMFLHKLGDYHAVSKLLGTFGEQLQSSMINFSRDMIVPLLMSPENMQKMETVINDQKLIYLLRQSFIRWLLIHKAQLRFLFKRKGEENEKNKLKYDITV